LDFVDYTLTRLADDDQRESILDQTALERLLVAGYDTDALELDGPFEPTFDRMSLGVSIDRKLSIEGHWGEMSAPQHNQFLMQWSGAEGGASLRVDVLWQGTIVAQAGGGRSRVEQLDVAWPAVSRSGARASLQVGFSATDQQPPELQALPVCIAMLVRDAPLDVAALLHESRQVRERLQAHGAERPPEFAAVGQARVVVAWVVPGTVFDDADWPGGDPAAGATENNANRMLAASRWLARESIGVVTPPPRPSD
jgi:hypothetical protein